MSHEGDATIAATLRPIFLLVQHVMVAHFCCCGTPPPLHTATMISWNFPSVSNSPSSAKPVSISARRRFSRYAIELEFLYVPWYKLIEDRLDEFTMVSREVWVTNGDLGHLGTPDD